MSYFDVQKIRVATSSEDEEGLIVLADGSLVAVLAKLGGDYHGEATGHWFLEAGFGRCAGAPPSTFATLLEALLWIAERHDRGEGDLPRIGSILTGRESGAAAC